VICLSDSVIGKQFESRVGQDQIPTYVEQDEEIGDVWVAGGWRMSIRIRYEVCEKKHRKAESDIRSVIMEGDPSLGMSLKTWVTIQCLLCQKCVQFEVELLPVFKLK
jgi:hypothetical protein